MSQIKFKENGYNESTIIDSNKEIIKSRLFSLDPDCDEFCLGLSKNSDKDKINIMASYYVGVAWIKENALSALVIPKRNYDYLRIFSEVLEIESEKESDYLSKSYKIFFDQPEIEVSESLNISSPLIMLHFVSLVKRIVKKGLKKGYVLKEENLKSKLKGRLLFNSHLKNNIVLNREERCFCKYSEFTEDIPENRLIKKALLVVKKSIQNITSIKKQEDLYTNVMLDINKCLTAFFNVSEQVVLSEIKKHSFSKVFRDYPNALKLAQNILKHFDYSLSEASRIKTTLPFWIDMSKLFELYVYKILNKYYPNQIQFQVEGYYKTRVDFIKTSENEQLIIDAKYKPRYANSNDRILEDISEISRYARDKKILKKLYKDDLDRINNEIPKCLIICPENIKYDNEEENENKTIEPFDFEKSSKIWDKAIAINSFINFKKIIVELPLISRDF